MGQQLGQNKFLENALKYGWMLEGLPKTEQKTSYRTGDDGDLQKGFPKTPPHFVDNGDGTITDKATALMWIKTPDPTHITWNAAIDACNELTYVGHSDWRLPNIKELTSLIFYGVLLLPWKKYYLDDHYFPVPANPWYWSSTRPEQNPTKALMVTFDTGLIWEADPTWLRKHRPVRNV